MEQIDERLARLRAEITAGTYAPEPDDVAEALVGWIVPPEWFERTVRRDRSGRILDGTGTALHTADHADDRS
jgi:hypothetical protein